MAGGNRVQDFVLTLDGTAQRLSSLYASADLDVPVQVVMLQADGANANPIFVGGSGAVTTSAWGFRIEKATATVPPVPVIIAVERMAIRLSDLWVIGTNTEKLHVLTCVF